MKSWILPMVFTLVFIVGGISHISGWGFWAHQRINRAAVFTLPDSMRSFFYNHIDFITQESQMPDVRIYALDYRGEANRHYINAEILQTPFESVPKTLPEAVARYSDSVVQKAGLLPWYIDQVFTRLTKAFAEKNKPYILFYAGDLAHYLGDAHVPLHTTLNHDGASTGQKGIHSFWESELPEYLGSVYKFNTGKATYITDVKKEIWRIIQNSNHLVDTVLLHEKQLRSGFPANQVYLMDPSGNILKNRYNQIKHSFAYSKSYNDLLNGMVERQLRLSIAAAGNFWYTAWVNAGRPDLNGLDPESLTRRNRKFLKKELSLWRRGELFGLKSSTEF
ncbi:MAG: zinc dependent phospholipase C family protein [Chitinophagaceae bacterium]